MQLDSSLLLNRDIEAFLGVKVQRNQSGNIKMSQQGLTDTIISISGLQSDSTTHDTPAKHPPQIVLNRKKNEAIAW